MYSFRCFSLKKCLQLIQVCAFPAQAAEKRSACGHPAHRKAIFNGSAASGGTRFIAKRFSMKSAAPGGIRSTAKHFLMDRCRISAAG